MFALCCITLFPLSVRAAINFDDDLDNAVNKVKMMEGDDGNMIMTYTAKDTTATSTVRFATYGFSVEPQMTDGTPKYKTDGKFFLTDGQKYDKVIGNFTYVKYTFSSEQIQKAFKKSGISAASLKKNGGYVYLNSIFKVHYYDKTGTKIIRKSGYYYTLSDIKKAASWKNKDDFKDHFDIQVEFKPQKVPVYFTQYIVVKGKLQKIKSKKVATVNALSTLSVDQVLTGLSNADMKDYKITYNGNDYYLYRSSWSDYANPLKNYTMGVYRKQYGIVYDNYHPITETTNYKNRLNNLWKRSYDVPMEGIEITFWYRHKPTASANQTDKEQELNEPNADGVINAMDKGSEEYKSSEGIPASEQQYVNVVTEQYLASYTFTEYSGSLPYSQIYDYQESTKDKEGKIISVTKTDTKTVYRNYSYWKITNLKVYSLSGAIVSNYSLPGGSVTIPVGDSYSPPSLSYNIYSTNLIQPSGIGTYEVGQIKVRNDKLVLNGKIIMDPGYVMTDTNDPSSIPIATMVGDDVLLIKNQLIDAEKANGDYDTQGKVIYKCIANSSGPTGDEISYDTNEINNVVIHTPTICDAVVNGAKKYNQKIYPDQGVESLVLDQLFTITFPTEGWHSELKGYQNRDYARFMAEREVKFPFDVYINNTYYKADTWIDATDGTLSYYLPTWVDEGYYTIDFRTRTINCDANDGLDKTEESANTDYENYVATSTCDVEVSGRIYNLTMYDHSNYPLWENVFRKKNSLELTGFNYKVGQKNQNGEYTGRYQRYTFPLINGSHPLFNNIGILKTGYVSRFYLTTIGNMYTGTDDSVCITPTFYYVSADGKKTEKVDIYYTETIAGKLKKMIKIGSNHDLANIKSMCIGNSYTSVPTKELSEKSILTGRTLKSVKADTAEVYTFGFITIPDALRTFIGESYVPNNVLPEGVSKEKAYMSVQKWYFEYYLPSEIHICDVGFDVNSYAIKNGGIDYNESFWKTGGYLKVSFDIITKEDGMDNLSYINSNNEANGYCNMWSMEGFSYTKEDFQGTSFSLGNGDTLFYYLNRTDGSKDPNDLGNTPYNPGSAADDYISGGTH